MNLETRKRTIFGSRKLQTQVILQLSKSNTVTVVPTFSAKLFQQTKEREFVRQINFKEKENLTV